MAQTAGRIALLTAGAVATGFVGYAIYFDYMRRNSPDFRRSLRKQAEAVNAAAEERALKEKARTRQQLLVALREIQADTDLPVTPEQQEMYFQEQVALGEGLAASGPEKHVEAASHFYRALRVYPQPVELLMIYQKVVPPPVFALVIEISQLSGPSPGAGAAGGAGGNPLAALLGAAGAGATATPARPQASVADLDDNPAPAFSTGVSAEEVVDAAEEESQGEDSPAAGSAASGASWEKVDEA